MITGYTTISINIMDFVSRLSYQETCDFKEAIDLKMESYKRNKKR